MRMASLSRFGMVILTTAFATQPVSALKPTKPGRVVNPLFFQAPECAERPVFLSETRTEVAGGFAALPKTLLVARDAEMWVESRDSGEDIRVHAYQSFVKRQSRDQGRVLCGSMPENFSDRFSLSAPTLIDVSRDQKVGHSVWQFQVIADHKGYSMWNKKSLSFAKAGRLEDVMRDQNSKFHVYQTGHNEYELVVQKDLGAVTQTLSIRYEAVR